MALWDINNFSGHDQARIFSCNRSNTSHFADLTVARVLSARLPLRISWSTILLGRDTYSAAAGHLRSTFSNYVQFEYPVWSKANASLRLYAGGAFAIGGEQSFYAAHPNFTNIGAVCAKNAHLGSHELPVAATAMWNPEKGYGAVQVALTLF